jgi:heme-degrading monooxygenase HmoA
MAKIGVNQNLCTVLEIFSLSPHQDSLIKLLQNTNSTAKQKPGYVASNILKSLDGIRVIHYTQWESPQAYQSAQASPEFQANMEAYKDWVEGIDRNIYEVAFTNGEPAAIGEPYDKTIMTNLFSLAGARQSDVLKVLVEFIDSIVRQQDGYIYISTNFHRSLESFVSQPEFFKYLQA